MNQSAGYADFPLYGFKTPSYVSSDDYGNFENDYINTVRHRHERWEKNFPNSLECQRSRKLKRFCRKGIPPNDRGEVWLTVCGARNRMMSNRGVYQNAVRKEPPHKCMSVIQVDLPRTYPENVHFQGGDTEEGLLRSLKRVLMAFASQFPYIGYCQGFNFVAGILLLVLHGSPDEREEKAFWLLDVLFSDILPNYYTDNMVQMKRDCRVLGELLRLHDRQLYEHIISMDINFEILCTKWFICLYADVVPIETTLRIFDSLFYEGDKILFRAGLALIELHRQELMDCKDFPEVIQTFRNMCRDSRTLRCHQFLQAMFKIPRSLPRSKIEKLRRHFQAEVERGD